MNEKQLERMRIRAERYANALEKAICEDIGWGKFDGFALCVAVEKTVSRFLAKLPNNLSFGYLNDVCHWIDLIINKDDGNCSACFSSTSFNIEVEGMDATHYYKNGYDRCRFERFNADIARMIANCFESTFDDVDWDGNRYWLLYYKPMPFWEFEKDLKCELMSALRDFLDEYKNEEDYPCLERSISLNGEMGIFNFADLVNAYKQNSQGRGCQMLYDDLIKEGVSEFAEGVLFNKAQDWYDDYVEAFEREND